MKRTLLAVAISSLLVSIAWASSSFKFSRANQRRVLSGDVLSASTELSGPSQTETVYVTPDMGDFVLTQFCTSFVNGGMRLDAANLGGIAQSGLDNVCYTFTPGVSIPKGSEITCSTSSFAEPGSYFCMISGLQS